jgi:hypothetical protein
MNVVNSKSPAGIQPERRISWADGRYYNVRNMPYLQQVPATHDV